MLTSDAQRLGDAEYGFLKSMHDSLPDRALFEKYVQKEILDKLPPGEKTKAYFKTLIGGILAAYAVIGKGECKYNVLVNNNVEPGSTIDNIFYPTGEVKDEPVIIHEYRKLPKTRLGLVSVNLKEAFGKILEKGYLGCPLGKKKYFASSSPWETIKLRSIVFFQDEVLNQWLVSIAEKELSIELANRLYELFKKYPTVVEAQEKYAVSSVYDLIDKIAEEPPIVRPPMLSSGGAALGVAHSALAHSSCRESLLQLMHDCLSDRALFTKHVQEKILRELQPGLKTKEYFQALMGCMVIVYELISNGKSKYNLLVRKSVSEGVVIENIFYPKPEIKDAAVIVHEYIVLPRTIGEPSKTLEEGFRSILEKRYLDEPLSKKRYNPSSNQWESIKLRSVLFVRDEVFNQWSIHTVEKELSVELAIRVSVLFNTHLDFIKVSEKYDVSNVYDLIDKIAEEPPVKRLRMADSAFSVFSVVSDSASCASGAGGAASGGAGARRMAEEVLSDHKPAEGAGDGAGGKGLISDKPDAQAWSHIYYKEGLDKILRLRLLEGGVKILKSITCSDFHFPFPLKLDTEKQSVVLPILYEQSKDKHHWVGLVIREDEVIYIDPENALPPKSIVGVFGEKLIQNIVKEQSCSNNCGPELIEHLAGEIMGFRIPEEQAVIYHSRLVEQSLLEEEKNPVLKLQITQSVISKEASSDPLYLQFMKLVSDLSQAAFLSSWEWSGRIMDLIYKNIDFTTPETQTDEQASRLSFLMDELLVFLQVGSMPFFPGGGRPPGDDPDDFVAWSGEGGKANQDSENILFRGNLTQNETDFDVNMTRVI